MPNVVGQKGQVVISKKIRDELGVKPGWWALQSIVDGQIDGGALRYEPQRDRQQHAAHFVQRPTCRAEEAMEGAVVLLAHSAGTLDHSGDRSSLRREDPARGDHDEVLEGRHGHQRIEAGQEIRE